MATAYDVIVVGAGAAGLGAAARLRAAGLAFTVLEARTRVGGRGHTVVPSPGVALDLGCGWLHSARRNSWTRIAEALGLHVDRSPASWGRPALNLAPAEQQAWRRAFSDFEARLEAAAAAGPDAPAASLFTAADAPWRARLDAFSSYYNGAPFEEISIHDYAAYDPGPENWRVREGYGALMQRFARDLPIAFGVPVRRIDRSGASLRAEMDEGVAEAAAVIVCVPTTVLAEARLAFDPPLPELVEAAAALPLGNVDKAFLGLADPAAFAPDTRVQPRSDTDRTAAYALRPMGLPVIECFFGGPLAAELDAQGPGAFAAFAREELARALGADFARGLTSLAESRWSSDPCARGAYSHARPGMAHMRARLVEPWDERIFLAGEACSPHDFSTAHGAYDTGVAAAERVLRHLNPSR